MTKSLIICNCYLMLNVTKARHLLKSRTTVYICRPYTDKLSNVTVTGFGERCNLVRESEMLIKDEAEISSTVRGVK